MTFAIAVVRKRHSTITTPMLPPPAAGARAFDFARRRHDVRQGQAQEVRVQLPLDFRPLCQRIEFIVAVVATEHPVVELFLERNLFFVRALPDAQRLEEIGSQLLAQNGRMTVVREGISRPLTNIIRPPQLDPPLGGPVEGVNRHGASAPSALVTGENGHGLLPLPCEPWHAAFPHALFPESLGMTFAQADAKEEEAEARRQLPASRLVRFLRWGAQ